MNDVDFPVARVLAGIDAAAAAGLPVKVNVVVKRGLNESSILDIARRFRGTGHTVRFIEFMDVGATNGWRMDDVVPAAEIVSTIGAEFPLEPVDAAYRGEVAERYRYLDGAGRDRRHCIGHPALLRGLHARADLGGREALHLPLRHSRSRSPRTAALRLGETSSKRRSARSGRAAPTATPRSAPKARRRFARSRCRTSAAERPTRSARSRPQRRSDAPS